MSGIAGLFLSRTIFFYKLGSYVSAAILKWKNVWITALRFPMQLSKHLSFNRFLCMFLMSFFLENEILHKQVEWKIAFTLKAIWSNIGYFCLRTTAKYFLLLEVSDSNERPLWVSIHIHCSVVFFKILGNTVREFFCINPYIRRSPELCYDENVFGVV